MQIPNTYNGIVFDPSGTHFYVAGGPSDNVHTDYSERHRNLGGGAARESELALGHSGRGVGLGVHRRSPCAAGVAISNDGQTLVVANYYNDSITVFNGGFGNWSKGRELDLRPGKSDVTQAGTPGGEYPFWVVVKGNGSSATAYVSSIRDREIVVVNLRGAPALFNPNGSPAVTARIQVKGQPNKMTLNAAQSLLYVAEDQSDTVDVIDTANERDTRNHPGNRSRVTTAFLAGAI